MADIELIVKIPEEKIVIEYGEVISIGRNNDKELADYIFAGTPLEKHDEEIIKETVASIWGKPPCDDAISRQAVLDTEYQIKEINGIEYVMLSEVQMKIRKMPPVYPQNTDVTDKIRADIEFLANSMAGHTGMVCAEDVFAIIDLYRREE